MIITNEFQFTPKEFFWLSLRLRAKRSVLIIVLMILITQVINLSYVNWDFATYIYYSGMFFTTLLLFYLPGILLIILIQYFNFRSKKYKIYYDPRHYEIDNKTVKIIRSNGATSSYVWSDILKILKTKDRYCLMVSKAGALHVPFNTFKSKKDEKTFKKLLVDKNLT